MSNWYKKCMPKIKDVEPFLKDLFKEISSSNHVRGLYVWGSYASHLSNPNFRLKDIDIIARTKFHSGDLVSVNDDIIHGNYDTSYLENVGFDPSSVKFSQDFVGIKKYNIDHWALSHDRKLLHWGPILINRQESDSMKKEAEKHASDITGLNKGRVSKASENEREGWYDSYRHYINRYFADMPSGWYQVEDMKIKDILDEAVKI